MSEELIPGVMKNIDAKTVVTLKDQVACLSGQVISKTLAQNEAVSVTLFGFGAGEENNVWDKRTRASAYGMGRSPYSCRLQ